MAIHWTTVGSTIRTNTIYIGVSDLEAVLERAKQAGATLISEEIESMPWGERLFYAHDPFQNPICLVDDQTLFMGSGK